MTTEIKVRTWLWVVLATVVVLGGGFTYWYTAGNKGITSPTTSPTPTLSTAKKSPTASPTTASTADWQTYTNTPFKYSVKLPKEGTYTELTTGDPMNEKKGYIVDFKINNLSIRINASDNSRKDKTLETLLETRNNASVPMFVNDRSKYSEIKVNNQRAFQYINAMSGFDTRGLDTLFLGDDFYYQIEISAGTIDNPRNLTDSEKETYNTFISTFQITK